MQVFQRCFNQKQHYLKRIELSQTLAEPVIEHYIDGDPKNLVHCNAINCVSNSTLFEKQIYKENRSQTKCLAFFVVFWACLRGLK